jgi:hypothetical protein
MKRTRVVQTEVDPATHARLQHIAERRSIPLKALVREALQGYADRVEGDIAADPAFVMIGCWDLKGKNWSERKDWRP